MLRPHRLADAFQCFDSADAIAPEALKPYLKKLRTAPTAIDPKVRNQTLRKAHRAGGDGCSKPPRPAPNSRTSRRMASRRMIDRRGVRVRRGPGPELSHMRWWWRHGPSRSQYAIAPYLGLL